MPASPLRGFNRCSVDELIHEGIDMVYCPSLIKKNYWGLWMYDECIIQINPELRPNHGKAIEDVVIIHEWLHGYEDMILNLPTDFRETQIDWWARYHLRRDQDIANYMRSFFSEQGF